MDSRPNILVLMTDQWAGNVTSWEGHPAVITPNLDALARRSTVFSSAYCASPLCAPSRASFMTGRLPSRHGVFDNAAELPASVPTFAHVLRAAGYRTVLCGKMHFVGPDQLHGFEERLTTDIYPADFGWVPDWTKPDERIDWWYHNMASVQQAGEAEITNQLAFDDETAFRARARLRDFARNGEAPFCMVVSFTHPHDPYAMRRRYQEMIDPARIPGPSGGFADDPHSRRLRHVSDMDAMPTGEEEERAARQAYLGALAYLDEQIGEILAILGETGQADNTIILFTSDHGDMLGDHGLWYKMSFFEGSVRVPLLVHDPTQPHPRRVTTNVSLLDIMPTLAGLAGTPSSPLVEGIDGESLLPLLGGGELARGDRIFAEYQGEGSIAPMVMIKDGSLKYIHSESDPPLFFDLDADPLEETDIAATDPRAAVLARVIGERFHLGELNKEVLRSQKRRRELDRALRKGVFTSWDFQPFIDESRRFMRNHLDLNDVEEHSRFPRPVNTRRTS
ncbi:MAG: choline-sulfatase [Geminicoccaceae bacterium]|nr:choline-sulfatase [Geminicoccaceae bacterium]